MGFVFAAAVLAAPWASMAPAAAQGEPGVMFPALATRGAEVSQVTVEGRRYKIVVELRDGRWVAADRGDYPVRPEPATAVVAAMTGLVAVTIWTEDPELYRGLDVAGPGPDTEAFRVTIAAGNGEVLADAIIGTPTSIPGTPPRSGMAVRRFDEAAVWLAEGSVTVPNLFSGWFEPLLRVPGREVGRIAILAGEAILFDAIKVDFATADYELTALDPLYGDLAPAPGMEGTAADDNAVRALAQAILTTAFEDARRREEIVVPPEARTVLYETRGGLSLAVTLVDQDGAIWVVYAATAAPGTEAVAQAADITTRTERWAFRLPEALNITLTRDIAALVVLPAAAAFDPAAMP